MVVGSAQAQGQTMQKQWQLIRDGQAYKLKLGEAPVRAPGANEVQIKVHAASMNRRDVFVMRGSVSDATPPHRRAAVRRRWRGVRGRARALRGSRSATR